MATNPVPDGHPPHSPGDWLVEGEWYACERPEARHDPDFTAYWSECRPCRLAFLAACLMMPGEAVDLRTPEDPTGRIAHTLPRAV